MPISSGPWGFWKAWLSERVQGVGRRCTPGECLELLSPSPEAAGSSQKCEGDCRGELRLCTRVPQDTPGPFIHLLKRPWKVWGPARGAGLCLGVESPDVGWPGPLPRPKHFCPCGGGE